jgi:hypothetical protein
MNSSIYNQTELNVHQDTKIILSSDTTSMNVTVRDHIRPAIIEET